MTPIDDFSRADMEAPIGADVPAAAVLTNGRYAVLVTAIGTGYSAYGGMALTRWVPDHTSDALGFFLYIKDEQTGEWWTNGVQPSRHPPRSHAMDVTAGRVTLRRTDGDLETVTEICVAPEGDVELRRVTFINRSETPRALQLTTYTEVVLNTPEGDAGHPAFSKLFVQTVRTEDGAGLLAKRRPRSPNDSSLWLEHRLWCARKCVKGDAEVETDRARFIGRGRNLSRPRAMDAQSHLSGSVGNVLDPVLSIRRRIIVPACGSATVIMMLAASTTREDVENIARKYGAAPDGDDPMRVIDEAFRAAAADAPAEGDDVASEMWAAARDARYAIERLPSGRSERADLGADLESEPREREELVSFNGYGGFSLGGTEYVIRFERDGDDPRLPPQPWANVIANERIGFVASESGAMSTWCENSRKNRLTPWSNDPVRDPHGEALYIRDDDTGDFWSPTPGPVIGVGEYETRHGFGYTVYRHASSALEEEIVVFVPRHDPVKITRVRVTNHGHATRQLSVFSYSHLVLGGLPWETAPNVVTSAKDGVIRATNLANDEFAHLVAFATAISPSGHVHLTTDRRGFIGVGSDTDDPAALHSNAPLDGRTGSQLDPCAAVQVQMTVAAGQTVECVFLLGEGTDDAEVTQLVARYRERDATGAALADVRVFWLGLVSGIQIATPSPAIDLMVNGWLTYQNLSCRVWGRTAFYQSGGAFGFRDQLQDTAALVYLDPALTREQILLHAAHQFVEGDVLHWWHPPTSAGIRTHFSDDLLWLPYVTAFYVQTTGDESVLSEVVPYVTAPPLPLEEDEAFVVPAQSGTSGSVYEHCVLTIDRSLKTGVHGLPLMGTGDWNDGMNRVGREGRGESVWLGFFLVYVLKHFIPVCERAGDRARAGTYRDHVTQLTTALNDAGWDGDWYRRAFYDDGTPLGSAKDDECRIDAIAQAWSVISGVASPHRAKSALDAMESHLVSEHDGIIRLLTPAFDQTPRDPGYIKGYLPGVRENGGQYTHGALWAVRALAEYGSCSRAAQLLTMVSPVTHGRDADAVARYQVEPYVIAADVYGVAPHVGRGGWTWYTGSAGWMFRVALESILGVEIVNAKTLLLRPCIPDDWPGFKLRYRIPGTGTTYELIVTRGGGESSACIDAGPRLLARNGAIPIPLVDDGESHIVTVTLGESITSKYAAERQPSSEAP